MPEFAAVYFGDVRRLVYGTFPQIGLSLENVPGIVADGGRLQWH